ncbi:MAG: AmmeMemoRadiSam system protein B, partial [Patescibacteria group bacterium]|nr:AmmeMemoRadiSam system protein B [Patescibacteria group bacterium]
TPYGHLEADREALNEISGDELRVEGEAIKNEHAITSEVAFIKKTFPQAKFLPIILKPGVSPEQARELAKKLFELGKNEKILVLASVDFSHYKDSQTARENDQESIAAIRTSALDKIYGLDIDSPAAIYTLLKYSQLNQVGFELLNNSNSALLADKPDLESTTSYVTGYFVK